MRSILVKAGDGSNGNIIIDNVHAAAIVCTKEIVKELSMVFD